ncbi:putative quinol monooxygenase [Dactylosporangium sp. NPDC051541]|uniref:putative quinol monooxygenase n=1 Tax=Dactylosporangium sp. NPDC051541 TaxID=3363977 RepID=UPI0037907ACB
MLIVAGAGYVDPAQRTALLELLVPAVRAVRDEPGCLDYQLAADPVEADRVNIFERWASPDDLNAHLALVARSAPPMEAVRRVEIVRYEVSSAGPLGV